MPYLSISVTEEAGEGDISKPSARKADSWMVLSSDKRADSRMALFFLRPGQVAIIMSAMVSVTRQLLHGSGTGPIAPTTQPGGHAEGVARAPLGGAAATPGTGAPGKVQAIGALDAPTSAGIFIGVKVHVTPVTAAQPQPDAHILLDAPTEPGTPGMSKGACAEQPCLVIQRVEVFRTEETVVLDT